jgi:hypothetical protein
MTDHIFFNSQELQLISTYNTYKKLEFVHYHFWINESDPLKKFSFIDTISLEFEAKKTLFFKINDFDTGIALLDEYDFEKEKQLLKNQFQDKIVLKKVSVHELPMWQKAINNQFKSIEAELENGKYLNNSLQIRFKNHDIEINFSPVDGLLVTNPK